MHDTAQAFDVSTYPDRALELLIELGDRDPFFEYVAEVAASELESRSPGRG